MNVVASLLLNLAHALAPKPDKLWIGDMRLEAAFVPNKLGFAFSALGLACKFRFVALKYNRPVGIAFASVALAALATFLVIPRMFVPEADTATMSSVPSPSYEDIQDIAQERGISAEAQPGIVGDAAPAEDLPESAAGLGEASDSAADTASATLPPTPPSATDLAEVPPSTEQAYLPEPSSTAPQTQLADEIDIPDLARVAPEPAAETESAPAAITPPVPEAPIAATPAPTMKPEQDSSTAEPASEQSVADNLGLTPSAEPSGGGVLPEAAPAESAQAKQTNPGVPAPRTPATDTQVISTLVRGESVVIEVKADTLLTLYRDTNFSGSPRLNRYVTAGETFIANVPFSLYTDNAAAISISADGNSLALGKEGEEQFRIFSKP